MMGNRVITAIDIGTTKVSALAAEMTDKGLRILGVGIAPSRGVKRGVVVNIDEAADAVRSAMRQAEAATGKKITRAVIGISGRHIAGFPSNGIIGLQGRKITHADSLRAVDSAKTVYIPLDREVLHVLPLEFILDGQKGITDPVGMSGVRLESRVYIITAHAETVQNLERACEQAGLEVLDVVFQPVATALAALTHDEFEKGVVLVDIGGGTTEIVQFRDGALVHAAVLGIGGLHVTNDLAVCLKVGAAEAEHIKTMAGAASSAGLRMHEDREISLPGETGQKISRQQVISIIQPRCEELFEMVSQEIGVARSHGAPPGSVVLTGGTALLSNISRLAASVLGMPARIGLPHGVLGMKNSMRTPAYTAGIGLLAYTCRMDGEAELLRTAEGSMLNRIKDTVKRLTGHKDFLEIMHKKKKGVSYV